MRRTVGETDELSGSVKTLNVMPFVQVSMGTGRTPEQKRALLDGISEVVHTTLGADYDSIRVWIVELDPDHVMVGQESLTERRARTQ